MKFRAVASIAVLCCSMVCLPIVVGRAQAAEVVVSAAASLTNAFNELKALFEKQHPGLVAHCNYAASGALFRHIQEGAPVDVFAAADQITMDKAVAAGVVDAASRRNFVRNSLVLIVPRGCKRPATLADLSTFARIAVGAPASVPAGRYAREALQKAGLWDRLQGQLIFGNNVRQVLGYVAQGEVDAGLVYATDARQQAAAVDIVMTVAGHAPVLYPIAVVSTGKNPAMGQAFLDFALTPEAGAVLAGYGFERP